MEQPQAVQTNPSESNTPESTVSTAATTVAESVANTAAGVVGEVVDAASIAAAGIADAAKLADPETMAAAVVDLGQRVGQMEELIHGSGILGRIEAFFKQHFPSA